MRSKVHAVQGAAASAPAPQLRNRSLCAGDRSRPGAASARAPDAPGRLSEASRQAAAAAAGRPARGHTLGRLVTGAARRPHSARQHSGLTAGRASQRPAQRGGMHRRARHAAASSLAPSPRCKAGHPPYRGQARPARRQSISRAGAAHPAHPRQGVARLPAGLSRRRAAERQASARRRARRVARLRRARTAPGVSAPPAEPARSASLGPAGPGGPGWTRAARARAGLGRRGSPDPARDPAPGRGVRRGRAAGAQAAGAAQLPAQCNHALSAAVATPSQQLLPLGHHRRGEGGGCAPSAAGLRPGPARAQARRAAAPPQRPGAPAAALPLRAHRGPRPAAGLRARTPAKLSTLGARALHQSAAQPGPHAQHAAQHDRAPSRALVSAVRGAPWRGELVAPGHGETGPHPRTADLHDDRPAPGARGAPPAAAAAACCAAAAWYCASSCSRCAGVSSLPLGSRLASSTLRMCTSGTACRAGGAPACGARTIGLELGLWAQALARPCTADRRRPGERAAGPGVRSCSGKSVRATCHDADSAGRPAPAGGAPGASCTSQHHAGLRFTFQGRRTSFQSSRPQQ